jgi:hypothetical protein
MGAVMAGAVMAVATAAAGKLIESLNGVSEQQQRLAEAAEERAEKEQQENEKITNSVADLIVKYQMLRNEWQNLSDTHSKNQWIKENQSNFKQLGITVKDVKTAEDVFVNNTQKVVSALIARAKAEAYGEIYKEKLKDKIKNDMNPTVENGRMYRKQNRNVRDIDVEGIAGVTADDINWNRETVMKNGVASTQTKFGSYKQSALNKINAYRNKMALGIQGQEEEELNLLEMNIVANQTRYENLTRNMGIYPTGGGGGGRRGTPKPKKTPEQIIQEQYDKMMLKSQALANDTSLKSMDLGEPSDAFKAYTSSLADGADQALSPLQKLNAELEEMKANLEKAPDSQAYQQGLSLIAEKQKEIDQFTGANIVKQGKETEKSWKSAASAASSFGSALSGIDDPAAKIAGTIAQAVANIALAFSSADMKDGETGNVWYWIAATAAGVATMISTISTIRSATGYAQGGIIKGNSYSGDNIMANGGTIGLNAGEVVLTKAMQGNLASQLADQNRGLQIVGVVKGESLVLVSGAYRSRTGHGTKGERLGI